MAKIDDKARKSIFGIKDEGSIPFPTSHPVIEKSSVYNTDSIGNNYNLNRK